MHKQIFVNLHVADLPRSKRFFEALGLAFEPRFTNDQGACLVIGENIYAMLLTRPMFEGFAGRPVSNPNAACEVMLALSCDSRDDVDALVAKALAAGARAPRPVQDHGFMYGHSFDDPDGHIWEVFFMDPNAAPPAA